MNLRLIIAVLGLGVAGAACYAQSAARDRIMTPHAHVYQRPVCPPRDTTQVASRPLPVPKPCCPQPRINPAPAGSSPAMSESR